MPVRLVPFLTRRQRLTPDYLAQIFSWRHPWDSARRWSKDTYQLLSDGTYSALQPRDWDAIAGRLASLENSLRNEEQFDSEFKWDRGSVELLPPGVFVWRDELESEYARLFGEGVFFVERPGLPRLTEQQYDEALNSAIETGNFDTFAESSMTSLMTRPGDGELTFDPLLSAEDRRLAFEGFGVVQQAPPPRPPQRFPAQESAILAKLAELDIDAQALPPVPKGSPSQEVSVLSANARKGALARHSPDNPKNQKAQAKEAVRGCWQAWQSKPANYESTAAFARDMLDKHPDVLTRQEVIERWVRTWREGT